MRRETPGTHAAWRAWLRPRHPRPLAGPGAVHPRGRAGRGRRCRRAHARTGRQCGRGPRPAPWPHAGQPWARRTRPARRPSPGRPVGPMRWRGRPRAHRRDSAVAARRRAPAAGGPRQDHAAARVPRPAARTAARCPGWCCIGLPASSPASRPRCVRRRGWPGDTAARRLPRRWR